MEHLSIKEIYDRLEELKGWELVGSELTKDFQFKDFKEAIAFVNNVGEEAERMHNYPDITIRHNRVSITLATKSANGVTHEDFKMARVIEQLV